jgi:flagellar basal-body rod modification protein FlgD
VKNGVNVMAAAAPGAGTEATYATASGGNQLGEVDFLMLLITELANQDPLDPMDDREFIAQMAQLNTLNQTTQLNENIRTMQMLQAASLVGRTVEAVGPHGEQVEGTVTEVWFVDSEAYLSVDGETAVKLEYVVRIM